MGKQLPESLRPLWGDLSHLLEGFGRIQDRLDPSNLALYIEEIRNPAQQLEVSLADAKKANGGVSDEILQVLSQSAAQILQCAERLESAAGGSNAILRVFQALRPVSRAQELLYSLSTEFEEVSRHFTHPHFLENVEVLRRIEQIKTISAIQKQDQAEQSDPPNGIIHFNNQKSQRGGYSLYIPEYYSAEEKWPLVVALHGGSGHGADFLWSWLRDARTFGFILASPSSKDRTWSIQTPVVDASHLNRMLSNISENYNIDTSHILLTGISDGGTYSTLLSIIHQSPFTHYAPVAAAVHVLLNRSSGGITAPVKDLKIYQVHGVKDWMFPVEHARIVASELKKSGADSIYKEIADLSHNYPRDENEHILRWFHSTRLPTT